MTALLYAIVCLCWGTTWLAIDIAVETVPPLTAAGLRFLIAAPMFLLFALSRGEPVAYPRRHLPFFGFVTLGYFMLPYWLLNFGEQYVSSGLTALLFSTMPMFILIFSRLMLKETIYLSQIAGMLVGFGALSMIVLGQGMHLSYASLIGVAAILAAAVLHGLSYVVTKRFGADIGIITFNTLPIAVAGAGLFGAGLIFERPDLGAIATPSVLALLYLGIVASVGGFIVYFHLLKKMRPVLLSYVFLIFPAISVVIGAWYDDQPLGQNFLIWMAVLLAGFAITKFPLETLLAAPKPEAVDG